jgi:hypothetical protein
MTLTVNNLVAALDQFPAYHAIDVFADDLSELRQPIAASASMRQLDAQGRNYSVTHQGRSFKLEIFPEQGVARLFRDGSSPTATGTATGFLAGSLVGAAIDAANKQKGAGLLGGALLGLLVGASLGSAAGEARRVFALTYDPASSQWRAYDGGLLRWMKDQLAVNAS